MSYPNHLAYCSPKHNFVYLAIPKAAATSFITWMVELEGAKKKKPEYNIYQVIQTTLLWIQHPQVVDPFKFTIMRSPWDRLPSAYLNKMVKDDEHHASQQMIGHLGKTIQGITFREFVHRLAELNLSKADAHWRTQRSMIVPFDPHLIGTMERLDHFLPIIAKRIGIPIDLGNENRAVSFPSQDVGPCMDKTSLELREKGFRPTVNNFYDGELRELVRKLYECDFEMYKNI